MATREQLLAATFLQLADTLVDDFDVVELLTMLSDRCVELLDAAGTGIMVANARGHLQMMAASSEDPNLLELFQIQNEEGDGDHTPVEIAAPHPPLDRLSQAQGESLLLFEKLVGLAEVSRVTSVPRAPWRQHTRLRSRGY